MGVTTTIQKLIYIISLLDSNMNIVMNYQYDTWWNILSITDGNGVDKSGDSNFIGNINPFRYRGYYYDQETNLYYLNSRYYNPEMGRFINADGIIGANEDILGYNLYAYVSNNPVNFSDPTGQSVWSWAKNKILKPMASGILQSFVDAGKPFGADFVAEAGHGTGYKGKLNMFGITVIDLGTSKDKSYSYNVTKDLQLQKMVLFILLVN